MELCTWWPRRKHRQNPGLVSAACADCTRSVRGGGEESFSYEGNRGTTAANALYPSYTVTHLVCGRDIMGS